MHPNLSWILLFALVATGAFAAGRVGKKRK